jgi:hypothetical protein
MPMNLILCVRVVFCNCMFLVFQKLLWISPVPSCPPVLQKVSVITLFAVSVLRLPLWQAKGPSLHHVRSRTTGTRAELLHVQSAAISPSNTAYVECGGQMWSIWTLMVPPQRLLKLAPGANTYVNKHYRTLCSRWRVEKWLAYPTTYNWSSFGSDLPSQSDDILQRIENVKKSWAKLHLKFDTNVVKNFSILDIFKFISTKPGRNINKSKGFNPLWGWPFKTLFKVKMASEENVCNLGQESH